MTTTGTVREWHDDLGWGVVDSQETPGGCWAHYSGVRQRGHRALRPGRRVHLEWEAAEQDGYRFRAVALWPEGSDPYDPPGSPSVAYRSVLTITETDPDTGETSEHTAAGDDPEAVRQLLAHARRSDDDTAPHGWTADAPWRPDQ